MSSIGCRLLIVGAALAGLLAGGCAKPPAVPDMPRLFVQSDAAADDAVQPQSKYALYEAQLAAFNGELPKVTDRDFSVLSANRAMIRLALGQLDGACQDMLMSQAVMMGTVEGEEGKALAAVLSDESYKIYKGEPYEIAMLNCMAGICCLTKGDDETAAIAFRRALGADKMSKEGPAREDFNLAYWGLGMASLKSDADASAIGFKRCNYKDPKTVADENLVVLISLGRAPWKNLAGVYGEQDVFMKSFCEPASAEVFVDGVSLGKGLKLIDLFEQSQGVPRTSKDVGQGVKGGAKFALALAAGMVSSSAQDAVESGWSVKADTRVCYMLPNEMHVVSGKVSPGPHSLRVKFYDAAGAELNRYEQVWTDVPAPAKGRQYVQLRAEFDRCNTQGPVAFTRINQVKSVIPKGPDGQPQAKVTTVRFTAENLSGVKVGDTVTLCHFYKPTQFRRNDTYDWRYQPMAFNNKGQPLGYPNSTLQLQDYDIGVIAQAKVTEISGSYAMAQVQSLNSAYEPRVNDMVTVTQKVGRHWK